MAADISRAIRQQLEGYRQAGVSHWQPADPSHVPESTAKRPAETVVPAVQQSAVEAAEEVPPVSDSTRPQKQSANATQQLQTTCEKVRGCTRCKELADTRTRTVFGVGNPQAKIMFIGEAPGADEDRQGEPFVGRAGQLLDKIIAACQMKREEIYIANILKCRPPGNRNPSPQEANNCREYLDEQIAAINPEYIVCWGTIAAQNLLDTTESIGKMRGRFFTHHQARVLCTYHPSYLLRNPSAKKPVWEDMKLLFQDMGIDLEAAQK